MLFLRKIVLCWIFFRNFSKILRHFVEVLQIFMYNTLKLLFLIIEACSRRFGGKLIGGVAECSESLGALEELQRMVQTKRLEN